MAIKVNGCTVIDDNRNIINAGNINVGVITATSFSGNGAGLTNIPSSVITGDLGGNVSVSTFTSSGTWTKPAGAKMVYVEVISGGGGGGAGGPAGPVATAACAMAGWPTGVGRGGCGGTYNTKLFAAPELPSTVSVTVGAGGPINCGTGGISSFESVLACGRGPTSSACGGNDAFAMGNNGGQGGGGQICYSTSLQLVPTGYTPQFYPIYQYQYTVTGSNGCACGDESCIRDTRCSSPATWTPAPASTLSNRAGCPGTGYAGGAGGAVTATLSISPTGQTASSRTVSMSSVTACPGGTGGIGAGGGGGSAGGGCGGAGGNGRVIVYTWE